MANRLRGSKRERFKGWVGAATETSKEREILEGNQRSLQEGNSKCIHPQPREGNEEKKSCMVAVCLRKCRENL